MALATSIPAAIFETIVGNLVRLFLTGAGGDLVAAHRAASHMVAVHQPETEDELYLAADIVSFGFHALDALRQAAEPDLPLTRQLRLRGSAVSLSRQSHKARHKLEQLRKLRMAGAAVQPAETPAPQSEPAPAPVETPAQPVAAATPAPPAVARTGGQNWSKGYQQREAARRITENLRKNQASAAAACSHTVALTG